MTYSGLIVYSHSETKGRTKPGGLRLYEDRNGMEKKLNELDGSNRCGDTVY